jgi:hypothetical protein
MDLMGHLISEQEQPLRPCRARGCSQLAFRTTDTLSYAAGQHVWICAAGHEIADERPTPGATWPPAPAEDSGVGTLVPRTG